MHEQSVDLFESWGRAYVSGTLAPAGEAAVSALDRGLLYGDGIFETVRVYEGLPFMLDAHIRRMAEGCSVIGLTPPDADEIRRAARSVLDENGLTGDAYLRITATRGATGRLWYDMENSRPTLVVLARPYSPPDHGKGSRLTESRSFRSDERSPLSRTKHTGILWKMLPRAQARRDGFDDALLLNTSGDVSEGTSANAFWVRNGELYTPALECGILAGVTRAIVIQISRENGIAVSEGCYPLDHLLGADEVFLTSSTAELTPVQSVEDRMFPGASGPVIARLKNLYREYVREHLRD